METGISLEISANNRAAITGIKQTKAAIAELVDEVKYYSDQAFGERDLSKIATYNSKIQSAQAEIKRLSNVGKEGFNELGQKITSSGNALGGVYSKIRSIAYILPGIGIAGIFNLAFEAVGKLISGLSGLEEKEKALVKIQEEYNKSVLQNRENAAQEISQLKALESVAANTSLSMDKRLAAVKKLRSEYPNYFKDLTNEQILTGQVTSATDQLTSAIYARAEARAREADIAKKANVIFQNTTRLDEIDNDLVKQRNFLDAQKKLPKKEIGSTGISSEGTAASITQQKINDLLSEKDKLLTENNRLQVDVATSQQRVNQISDQTILLDEKQTDALKKKNNEKKKEIDYNKILLDDYYKLKGLQPKATPVEAGGLSAFKKQQEKEQGKQVGGRLKDSVGSQALGNDIARITEERTEALKAMTEQMKKFQAVSQLAAGAVDFLFTNLKQGQNIADALIGVFENLANEIAKAAAKAVVLSIVASAFGIGETNIFKNFGKVLGFATGGTVTGPNSGYPVMLHGTEHIVRPDQMKSIISGAAQMGSQSGNGQMAVVLSSRVAGNDIYLSQKRTNYFRGLTT